MWDMFVYCISLRCSSCLKSLHIVYFIIDIYTYWWQRNHAMQVDHWPGMPYFKFMLFTCHEIYVKIECTLISWKCVAEKHKWVMQWFCSPPTPHPPLPTRTPHSPPAPPTPHPHPPLPTRTPHSPPAPPTPHPHPPLPTRTPHSPPAPMPVIITTFTVSRYLSPVSRSYRMVPESVQCTFVVYLLMLTHTQCMGLYLLFHSLLYFAFIIIFISMIIMVIVHIHVLGWLYEFKIRWK